MLRTTLLESISMYLDDCYGLAERTQKLYAWQLQRFADYTGDLPIAQVDARLVRSYMANLVRRDTGKKVSPAFADQVYRTLNTFFRWCVREEFLPQNPMDRVRKPRVPRRKSPRLSLEEVGRLLDAASQTHTPERDTAIVLLMLDSGLRRSEVVGLTLDSLDLRKGTVTVYSKGKEREVPIGAMTRRAIHIYLAVRPDCPGENALFINVKRRPLAIQGLHMLMRRLGKRAGIANLHCHLLRHTFANTYIANGGGLRKLQKILGHSDVTTTARIYTDPELAELQEEHARVSPLAQSV